MIEHKKIQLSDLCESIDYGFTASASSNQNGPKFLRITDIVPGYVNWSSVPFTSATEEEQEKYKLYDGDIVIARTGATTGASIYIKNPPDSIFASYLVRLKIKPTTSSLFISYFLKSSFFWNHIKAVLGDKSAQPNASAKTMTSVQLSIPQLTEQKAIASLLGALDNKIENNRQINQTLEEMGRAIFKSWFIDFDPVNTKAAGKIPAYMDAETAALFPNSFDNNGLPIGFYLNVLRNSDTEIESGKRPKGGVDKSLLEGIPSIGAESIQKIGDFEYSKVKFLRKEFAEKSSKGWVQNYDVALYKDGANVGDPTRIGLYGNGFPFDDFMVNEHVFLIRNKELGQPFLYYLFQSEMVSHQLKSMGTSKAAQPGLNQQEVLSCQYIAPPQVLLSAFNKLVLPFIDHRLSLGLENQTLAELRDTLLPKLMSGEIRMKDAEREVEAAV